MAVVTRNGLKEYALRALGAPVISINVADEQLEDRIDEALEFFRYYHYDGVEKVYLKQKISASELNITTSVADTFGLNTTITGATSGATALVTKESERSSAGTKIIVKNVSGTFAAGETISNGIVTAALTATNFVLIGEYDKKYITTSDLVYGVTRVLPFYGASTSKNIFDVQYQLRLHDLYDLTSTSVIYYTQMRQHLSLLDETLNGKPQFRFNQTQHKLQLDVNWDSDITLGDYIVVECYRALDPDEFNKVWSLPFIKHYTTALFKRQWGLNLKKFGGLTLPGGVTLDGQGVYDEAISEIKDLEEELINNSAPLELFTG